MTTRNVSQSARWTIASPKSDVHFLKALTIMLPNVTITPAAAKFINRIVRFSGLAAGAGRAFWLRTQAGRLPQAVGAIRKILDQHENVMVESNSIVEFFRPDLFLMLLDFGCTDFKDSSLRLMDRADAFIVLERGRNSPVWENAAQGRWELRPRFAVQPPPYLSPAVADFVSARF